MSLTEKVERARSDYDEVFNAGGQAEYERRWETYLSNTDGAFAFAGEGWDDETFDPPRGTVLRPTYATNMFSCTGITDLVALCEKREITLDFSQSWTLSQLFYGISGRANLTRVGVVNATKVAGLGQVFAGQSKLHTVILFVLKDDGSQSISNLFTGCSALVNLTIEGTIGKNGFNVADCVLLSHDSLMSIINHLQTKTSGTWTLTLGETNLAKLTDAEKAVATEKGWSLI